MLRPNPNGFTARILLWTLVLSSLWSAILAQYDPPATYYDGTAGQTGATLRATLYNKIRAHTKLSYANVWTALQVLDENPANTSHIRCVYTNASIPKADRDGSSSASVVWNREHSWPKSYGFDTESWPAYTDLHHLYACERNINSTRNNNYFNNCPGGTTYAVVGHPAKFNRLLSGAWEPWDDMKGDLARSMFYMDLRYAGGAANEPDLFLNNSTTTTGQPRMAMLDTLLAWHVQDPPDDRERRRNHLIWQNYQSNRNPFVDRPEFVCAIWGGAACTTSGPIVLTSGVSRAGSVTQNNYQHYQISVPSGTSTLTVQFTGGTGDPDLYVRYNAQPTTSTYGYRSWNTGPVESVTVNNPTAGTWYIAAFGYSSGTSTFTVVATNGAAATPTPTPTPTPTLTPTPTPPPGSTVLTNNVGVLDSVGLRVYKHYTFNVPAGSTKLTITTTGGSGDGDLYARKASQPTTSLWDFRSWAVGNTETITVNNPASGTWYIAMYGYSAASGYTIKAVSTN